MPYAFAYVRFSEAIPSQEADGLAYYEKALRTQSYAWGGAYLDVQAARTRKMPDRPAASLLLRRVMAGDAVIFPDTSSAFVSQKDFLRVMKELLRVEAEVHLLDLDIHWPAVIDRLGPVLRFCELTWDHQLKTQDRVVGNRAEPPFGYRQLGKGRGVKKRLVVDVREQAILNLAKGQVAAGRSAQEVADLLNREFGKNPRAKGRGVFTRLWVEKHTTNGDASATDTVPGDQVQEDQPAGDRAGE